MIAGGILLLLVSIEILLRGERVQKVHGEDIGIVHIAFPLLVGPGYNDYNDFPSVIWAFSGYTIYSDSDVAHLDYS